MLKILHTSDIHIGAKFSAFGNKAELQRKSLLDSFGKIVDLAISDQVHLLLIVGDLFDSNYPSYQSIDFVKSQLKKLDSAGIQTIILPGTHDCLSQNSIFKREKFGEQLSRLYIFNDTKVNKLEFSDIDLTVYGKANISNKSVESPLSFLGQFPDRSKTKYNIALAHGSIQIEGKSASDDLPIYLKDISSSGMDYIALGHWHGAQDFSSGGVAAWYAGSPEITYQEGKGGLGQGYALRVDIAPKKTEVNPIKISNKAIKEIALDYQILESKEKIYQEIDKLADPNLILTVNFASSISVLISSGTTPPVPHISLSSMVMRPSK